MAVSLSIIGKEKYSTKAKKGTFHKIFNYSRFWIMQKGMKIKQLAYAFLLRLLSGLREGSYLFDSVQKFRAH